MPLGKLKPQDIVVGGQSGDRLAWHDDCSRRDRHREHAARTGRQHGAFRRLLFDDFAVGTQCLEGSIREVEARPRLVELRLGNRARPPELLHAVEVDLRLLAGGALGTDARVESLHLQRQLGVDDEGHLVACGDAVAFADREFADRAADAGAGLEIAHGFHRGDHGFAVVDLLPDDCLLGRRWLAQAGDQHHDGKCDIADHSRHFLSRTGLTDI